jgi:hypothetical protein
MAVTPLYDRLKGDGVLTYYTEEMRTTLEMHIPFLLRNNRSTVVPIEPHVAYRHEYDFNSLLLSLNLPYHLHWITMRMNGMFSPSEYTKGMLSIIVPDAAIVEQIKSIQTTVHRVDE